MSNKKNIKVFQDQMEYEVKVHYPPKKIISLVPSQTELLFYLGLDHEVVGITRFCIHPKEKLYQKTKIGGPKKFNYSVIEQLKPDLIIGNKEENYQEGVKMLRKKYPVWLSDIKSMGDAYTMIGHVGELVNKKQEAAHLIERIRSGFKSFKPGLTKKVIYLIWKKPYMAVGKNTFIDEMISTCGFENVLKDKIRYPELTIDKIRNYQPDILLLSSEPYPFKEKHAQELRQQLPVNTKILIVNGEMFSWYGSRLLHVPGYFQDLHKKISLYSS